jgi:hypothetical protein
MKKWFRELLAEQEGGGSPSMTRFLSLVCVIVATLIALIALSKGLDLNAAAILCSTFLAFGTGSKVIQKFAESKDNPPAEVDTPQEDEK